MHISTIIILIVIYIAVGIAACKIWFKSSKREMSEETEFDETDHYNIYNVNEN